MSTLTFDMTPIATASARSACFWRRLAAGSAVVVCLAMAPAEVHAQLPGELANEQSSELPRRFALVIGSNSAGGSGLPPLRYADDDAARMAELLASAGTDVELLTSFDTESQQLFSDLVRHAHPATSAGVTERFSALLERMKTAQAEGPVEFTFYYSGHGDADASGRTFLTLEGGRLSRRDLLVGMLAESPAVRNHVLIDACRSRAFLVHRGADWQPDARKAPVGNSVEEFLDDQRLEQFPNTGVILAGSFDQKTHEWDRYRGGIFTHQLLSGLRGAADINGDGRLEYTEVGAFVSAANHGVSDPRAKLDVYVRPPRSDQRSPLLVHNQLQSRRVLMFVGSDAHHYVVEDERGLRLADLRRAGSQPSYLRLPEGRVYVRRRQDSTEGPNWTESAIAAADAGTTLAHELKFSEPQRNPRGALSDAFRAGLFTVGFGPGYYAGYTAETDMLAVEHSQWQIRIWQRVDGQMIEVGRVEIPSPSIDTQDVACDDCVCDDCDADAEDDEDDEWDWDSAWHGISLGVEFLPRRPDGNIRLSPEVVQAQRFTGIPNQSGPSMLRGFEIRWAVFSAPSTWRYPEFEAFVRIGVQHGQLDFSPKNDLDGFGENDPTALSYVSVPVYASVNFFALQRFPVRPLFGLGIGVDATRVTYAFNPPSRPTDNNVQKSDLSTRLGFEIHAGLDIRVTNYVGVQAEIRQNWAIRHTPDDLDGVPVFSATGTTLVTSLRVAFPGRRATRTPPSSALP